MAASKKTLDKSQYFGITEAGEVAFDLSCFDRLYDGNIIITKRLTDKLIEKLIEHKDKVILHLTCTGMGGSKVEPLVPISDMTVSKYMKLIQGGFPQEQVVLRVDPIVPTEKGINTACRVIRQFHGTGMMPPRVRYSVLDMYKHVVERFKERGFPIPYETFHAPKKMVDQVRERMQEYSEKYGFKLEACAEPGLDKTPCLSQTDIDLLNLTHKITLVGSAGQRKTCGCPANKKELLKKKPERCGNRCVYCFWKDSGT